MQQLCVSKVFNLYHIYQNNDGSECVRNSGNVCDSGQNVCDSGGMSATVGEMFMTVEEMSATVGKLNML